MNGEPRGPGMGAASRGHDSDASRWFGPFWLDLANELLWRGEQRVALKPKTFAVLRYLAERPERLITKRELLDALWGDVHVGDAVLKTHLREIRLALGDSVDCPEYIETAHGRGYRFVAKIERQPVRLPARSEGPVPSESRVVGRDAELSALEAGLERALRGPLQTVFLVGEAGAGKTTLAGAFLARVRQRGDVWVAQGQCIEQHGAGEPYMPVLEAFTRLGRGPDSSGVVELLRRLAPSWLVQMPSLLPPADAAELARRIGATPERMLREMAEAVLAISQARPLLLLFEDLHWADYSTLNLISYLARRPDPVRAMVIGTYRARGVSSPHHPLADIVRDLEMGVHTRQLTLADLSAPAVEQYVESRLPGHGLPSSVARLIWERTRGNPLFTVKLVESWIERRFLTREADSWQLAVDASELAREVPQSLSRMIEREIDLLADGERGVLEAASVAGVEFSVAAVAAAVERDVGEIERLCASWARRGLFLRVVGSSEWPDGSVALRCAFSHGLYQQVAYERIGVSRIAELHRRIARRLVEAYGAQAPSIASELAVHFERGKERSSAARYRVAAGELALRRSAYPEAIEHFQHGLVLSKRLPEAELQLIEVELCTGLGAALAVTRGYTAPEVDRLYARAKELLGELGDAMALFPVVVEGIWKFYIARGDFRTAGSFAQQCHASARQQGDARLRRETQVMLGASCFYLARFADAREHLEAALPLFDDEASPSALQLYKEDTLVAVYAQLAWAKWMLGSPDAALADANRAVALARTLAHPFTLVYALYFLLVVRHFRREYSACGEVADEVVALGTEHGFAFFAALANILRGGIIASSGQVASGLALMEEGWRGYQAMGAGTGAPFLRTRLAEVLASAHRVDEAMAHLKDALDVAQRNDDHGWDPEVHRLWGELAPETAEAHFALALELARQTNARSLELRAAISLAKLWCARGKASAAAAMLGGILSGFSDGTDSVDVVEARSLSAVAASSGAPNARTVSARRGFSSENR
jgi:DNA-binding winged helix-turn-helix (wHTH) protein/tetratricopeptide (TPR) repeat protein